jgi:hypothetical protein
MWHRLRAQPDRSGPHAGAVAANSRPGHREEPPPLLRCGAQLQVSRLEHAPCYLSPPSREERLSFCLQRAISVSYAARRAVGVCALRIQSPAPAQIIFVGQIKWQQLSKSEAPALAVDQSIPSQAIVLCPDQPRGVASLWGTCASWP